MFDRFANGDGTYNGVKALAAWSGLSEEEVAWTANRMKQLVGVEKLTADQAKAIVKAEAKEQPWTNQQPTAK